ncbi:MAG: hypothetical protein L3J91_02480, partial [Thermoplasmata archaeon]|nr:hypothetical protein [Thermoplasmata archaeon]
MIVVVANPTKPAAEAATAISTETVDDTSGAVKTEVNVPSAAVAPEAGVKNPSAGLVRVTDAPETGEPVLTLVTWTVTVELPPDHTVVGLAMTLVAKVETETML